VQRRRPTGFADAYRIAEPVPGWLTEPQARVLHAAAGVVPPGGVAVEIGSHHGRSAIVLAAGLPDAAVLVAVDPFGAQWRYGGEGTEQAFRANLAAAGVDDRVDVRVTTSEAALADWDDPLDLVYVDGKHDALSLAHDLGWARHLRPGGRVFVHDAFSSVGVTLGLLAVLMRSRDLRYRGRTGSLAALERARPSLTDRLRLLGPLPWFGRNVVVKVLLRLRLRPAARLLGHHDTADPY
jgi:hypothetical protein